MAANTGHNGYFGVDMATVFPCLDEENLVFGAPIDVAGLGGIIEIAMAAATTTETTYASDKAWIDSTIDNGFDGTMRIVNVWGHPVLRQAFAPFAGYEFATDGTFLGSSDKAPQKFALAGQQSGNIEGKRTCYLMCQLSKPDKNMATKEGGATNQPDEFAISARPVTLPSGWKGSFYENIPADGALFTNFFNAVRTDMVPASNAVEVAALSALTIGTTTLTPTFTANGTTYAATTTGTSVPVTAVPIDPASTIDITVGDTTVTNGGDADLESGDNTITVTVTNGEATRAYTVVVTRS